MDKIKTIIIHSRGISIIMMEGIATKQTRDNHSIIKTTTTQHTKANSQPPYQKRKRVLDSSAKSRDSSAKNK